ncbi:hypothetical protein GH733_004670 [Mirounga leonina]|nr:hypothetical protein GH733_004670 [Mirounga leonina]
MSPPCWAFWGPALVVQGLLWGDLPEHILSADGRLHISTVHQGEAWLPSSTRISVAQPSRVISLYDCVFNKSPGYDQKLHRDDREHAKSLGLHVNEEERQRPVGVLMSSVYGRRIHQPVEPLNRDHGRANHVKADFYRKNGIPSIKTPGFGHVSPA